MFNVTALLLDDAHLFSFVAFKTLTFHKVVERHTSGMVGSLVIVLLNIVSHSNSERLKNGHI